MGRLSEYRLFVKEFLDNFHTTGAVLPSGKSLSTALARHVGKDSVPKRILEVGPGTGAVTQWIVSRMNPGDRLDLVELNDRFVQRLKQRFKTEPVFAAVADRTQILHCSLEELSTEESYDLIISGLPLNNFSVEVVETILSSLQRRLARDGVLSFFEYIGIRRLRAMVSTRPQRERLRGIGRALEKVFIENEIHRDWIWPNVPPAWVHHVQLSKT